MSVTVSMSHMLWILTVTMSLLLWVSLTPCHTFFGSPLSPCHTFCGCQLVTMSPLSVVSLSPCHTFFECHCQHVTHSLGVTVTMSHILWVSMSPCHTYVACQCHKILQNATHIQKLRVHVSWRGIRFGAAIEHMMMIFFASVYEVYRSPAVWKDIGVF